MGQQKTLIISGEPEETKAQKKQKKIKKKNKEIAKKKLAKKPFDTAQGKEVKKSKKKTRSKKYLETKAKIDKTKLYSPKNAIKLAQSLDNSKLKSAIEIHISFNQKPEMLTLGKTKIIPDKDLTIHYKLGLAKDNITKIEKSVNQLLEKVATQKTKKDSIKSITICTTMGPGIKVKNN